MTFLSSIWCILIHQHLRWYEHWMHTRSSLIVTTNIDIKCKQTFVLLNPWVASRKEIIQALEAAVRRRMRIEIEGCGYGYSYFWADSLWTYYLVRWLEGCTSNKYIHRPSTRLIMRTAFHIRASNHLINCCLLCTQTFSRTICFTVAISTPDGIGTVTRLCEGDM